MFLFVTDMFLVGTCESEHFLLLQLIMEDEENSTDRLSRPGTKEEDNIPQPHLRDLTAVRPTSSYSLTHLIYLSRVSAVKMLQTMQTDREISRPGPCFTFLSVMLPLHTLLCRTNVQVHKLPSAAHLHLNDHMNDLKLLCWCRLTHVCIFTDKKLRLILLSPGGGVSY